MGAGIGLVLILRWFWWRINAWTEISALITSILITLTLEIIAGIQTVNAGITYTLFGRAPIILGIELQMHHKLLIIVPIAILVWLIVTFFTKPEKESTLKKFYHHVQPGGWWKPISKDIPRTKANVTKGFLSNWIAGIAFIFGATFAIGNLIFGNLGNGLLLTVISILGFVWIWKKTIVKLDSD